MGMPSISVKFAEKANMAIAVSTSGAVAWVLVGTGDTAKTYTVYDNTDIPATTTEYNKKMIKLAKKGYVNPTTKVSVYETPAKTEINGEEILNEALAYFSMGTATKSEPYYLMQKQIMKVS